jgi:hypothetical protein
VMPHRPAGPQPALSGALVAVVVLVVPAVALACGACVDAALLCRYWWINLPLAAVPPIFVELLCTFYGRSVSTARHPCAGVRHL